MPARLLPLRQPRAIPKRERFTVIRVGDVCSIEILGIGPTCGGDTNGRVGIFDLQPGMPDMQRLWHSGHFSCICISAKEEPREHHTFMWGTP